MNAMKIKMSVTVAVSAVLLSLAVVARDDEPDALSDELLTQDRVLLKALFDWAKENPPPKSVSGVKAVARVPYVRFRAADFAPATGDWKRIEHKLGPVLQGPRGHNCASCTFAVDIPEDGYYRLWTRYLHGSNTCETFRAEVHPPKLPFDAFDERFAWTVEWPYHPIDPIPDIQSVPATEDAFVWEPSRKMARLKRGRWAITVSGFRAGYHRCPSVSDFLFVGDPFFAPEGEGADVPVGAGSVVTSPEVSSRVFAAVRALVSDRAASDVEDWWRRWRKTLVARLGDPAKGDYDWGYFASLVYFDEESNCIARPSEIRAMKRYFKAWPDLLRRGFKTDDETSWRFPDTNTVGRGALGFWRSPNPWSGFTRFSPPMLGRPRWRQTMIKEFVDAREIDRTEHVRTATRGDWASELLMIRNNTKQPVRLVPKVTSDLPIEVRVVASTLTSNGEWSPMVLLKRREVTAPAGENTGLWLTMDCRAAAVGEHDVVLEFADKKVTLRVTVAEPAGERPLRHFYGWCAPFNRESAWAFYRDHGMDMINFRRIPKELMKRYGISWLMGVPFDKKNLSVESVRAIRDDLRANCGLEPEDYFWYLIDEPPTKEIPRWLAMADVIKEADPRLQLWCNLGDSLPKPAEFDVWLPFMKRWDAGCPFISLFTTYPQFKPFVEALREAGKLRMLYHTLDRFSTEKAYDAPLQLIEVGEKAIKENRNGFGNFTMCGGEPWDDLYCGNEDLAMSIYPGAWGRTLSTRNAEAIREVLQRTVAR